MNAQLERREFRACADCPPIPEGLEHRLRDRLHLA